MTIDETQSTESTTEPTWKKSACIPCECNCGVEIRLGDDGQTFERIRGDKQHLASKGYTCGKALRLDHYQNGPGERVLNTLRRREDGTTLNAIANDENSSMIVIDPRVTKTTELADFDLQVAPGRDAWELAATVAIIVQERLGATAWLAEQRTSAELERSRSPSPQPSDEIPSTA